MAIPPEANLSPAATDVIKRFMCEAENRLGSKGFEEIQKHPFFEGIDWDHMKKTRAPFAPKLTHDGDVTRFDKFDEEEPFIPVDEKKAKKVRKDNNFPGFTYNKDIEEQKSNFVKALNESIQIDSASTSGESPHQPRTGATGAARGGAYQEDEKLTPVVP